MVIEDADSNKDSPCIICRGSIIFSCFAFVVFPCSFGQENIWEGRRLDGSASAEYKRKAKRLKYSRTVLTKEIEV